MKKKYFDYYEDAWYLNKRYWQANDHGEYDSWFGEALEEKELGGYSFARYTNLYGGIQKTRRKFEKKKDYLFDGNPEGDE